MFFDLVKLGIRTCQLYQTLIVFWLASLALVAGQSCPPKESEMKVISDFLNRKLVEIRKYKPGTNPKDAEWIIYRMARDITTNNKFAPCNNGFSWQQVETDANQIKDDCFKPGDYTKPEPQQAIMNCANKYYPQFLIKYGKQGLESCACFSRHIVPNWKSRYQKYANDYVEEFKTLRHRKMTIAKIRGN